MHPILLGQLKRALGVEDEAACTGLLRTAAQAAQDATLPPQLAAALGGLEALLSAVEAAYTQADHDLALRTRCLERSADELNRLNADLTRQLNERGRAIRRLRQTLGDLSASLGDEGGVDAGTEDIDQLSARLGDLLREREANRTLLRNVIAAVPDLMWLKDAQGVYLDCNERFERLYGVPREQIVGRSDYDFVAPADADSYRAHDRKAMLKGSPSVNEEWATYADGHRELVETTKTPVLDHAGRLIGILGIAHDITERRRAEDALRASEQRFRRLLEQVPNISVQGYDVARRVLFWNEASTKLYGYSAEEAIGRQLEDLIIPQSMREAVASAHAAWVNGGQPIPAGELVLRRKDGSAVPVFSSHVMLPGPQGEPEMYCVDIDLTELKQAEDRLRLAASVFTHAWEGIMITDPSGAVIEVNAAFTRITGYTRAEVIGQNPRLLKSGMHGASFYADMWRDLVHKGFWHGEVWNRRAGGELYPELLTISTVRDGEGRVLHYVGLFADISTQKAHEAELEYLANHDALTQLPNRALLHDRLEQSMAQAFRRNDHLAVAYIDLDGFKSINDQYGHELGDQLLRALAAQMKSTLREGDTIARLGGDEFVAVLVDLPGRADFVPFVERLLTVLARPLTIDAHAMQVSASIGVTLYPQTDAVDPDQLLRQADLAMYQAKLAGKNRYHVFDTDLDRSVRDHHESLACIRKGMERGEFVLYYQPKVNLRSGQVSGAEALIRWQHPARGLLSPVSFLPVVEHHALGVELGEWVLQTALQQLAAWQSQGLTLKVSVNISAPHLQRADFVPRLRALLAAHPAVSAAQLQLEVLETSALEDMAHVSDVIEDCRELGVSFALDDFGTGYSSLTYLKRLPVRVLKIDQSFVRDMLDDPDDLAILEGVLGLTRAFGREAVAEGVETVRHGERLLQLGCEEAQGYGIARPMPAAEIPRWVARWRPDPAWQQAMPLQPSGLALLRAAVDFRAWFRRLEERLGGRSLEAPPCPIDDTALARWLALAPAGAGRAPLPALAGAFEEARLAASAVLRSGSVAPEVRAALGQHCEAVLVEVDEVLRNGACS